MTVTLVGVDVPRSVSRGTRGRDGDSSVWTVALAATAITVAKMVARIPTAGAETLMIS
jgi:hypothetical protein